MARFSSRPKRLAPAFPRPLPIGVVVGPPVSLKTFKGAFSLPSMLLLASPDEAFMGQAFVRIFTVSLFQIPVSEKSENCSEVCWKA